MNFNNIRTARDAMRYLDERFESPDFLFDGYEVIPETERFNDPLKRCYYSPRYNAQTIKFVEQLGGVFYAKQTLLDVLGRIKEFKVSMSGNETVDHFVIVGKIGKERVYVKVTEPNRKTIIIMHPYSHIDVPK